MQLWPYDQNQEGIYQSMNNSSCWSWVMTNLIEFEPWPKEFPGSKYPSVEWIGLYTPSGEKYPCHTLFSSSHTVHFVINVVVSIIYYTCWAVFRGWPFRVLFGWNQLFDDVKRTHTFNTSFSLLVFIPTDAFISIKRRLYSRLYIKTKAFLNHSKWRYIQINIRDDEQNYDRPNPPPVGPNRVQPSIEARS